MCKVFCHARIGVFRCFFFYFGKGLCDNVRYRGYFAKHLASLEVDDPTNVIEKGAEL